MRIQGFDVSEWLHRLGSRTLGVEPQLEDSIRTVVPMGDAKYLASPIETRDVLIGTSTPALVGQFTGIAFFGPFPFEVRFWQHFTNSTAGATQPDVKWAIIPFATLAGFSAGVNVTLFSVNPRLPTRITGGFTNNAAAILAGGTNPYAMGGKIEGGANPGAVISPQHWGPVYVPPGMVALWEGSLPQMATAGYWYVTEYESQPAPIT